MFDWDRDYTELVEGRASVTEPTDAETTETDAETTEKIATQPATTEDASSSPPARRRYLVHCALAAVFVAGMAFEKADAVQYFAKSAVSVDIFGPVVEQAVANPLPQGLLIYEAEEYRRLMAGLQGLNAAELDQLAQSARADMYRAPQGMVPYFRDALFLIQRKLDSHGL